MASGVIGSLRVNLGLDSAKFERGARRVKSPLAQMQRQFAAITGVAVAAGAAISAMALRGAKDIDAAAKSARRLGSSITGFRALQLAADEAGVNLSSLTSDLQTMNREIASIGITGNGKRALDALNLSLSDLQGLDADAKLAKIADQVKSLGLSTGKTTSILRDLGIRNREMLLLVAAGGDAIRAARGDIESYGLALNSVQAAKIEAANDAISRLGLVTQYAGQQLALRLVPAMGDLARSITDSLREGGLLRSLIDGLSNNIGRLTTYMTVAVGVFGARFAGALIAAKVATFSLAGALTFLRGALIRTGIGALIVGAGELVYQFSNLVSAAGGFGAALGLLADVAAEVWGRIKQGAWLLVEEFQSVGMGMSAAFQGAFADVLSSFASLTGGIADGWNSLMNTLGLDGVAKGIGADLSREMRDAADYAAEAHAEFNKSLNASWDSLGAPLKSVQEIRKLFKQTGVTAKVSADGVDALALAVSDITGGGGGASPLDALGENLVDISGKASVLGNEFGGKLKDSILDFATTGVASFGDLAKSIKRAAMEMLLFGSGPLSGGIGGIFGGGGGILGGIFGGIFGSANGNVFAGGTHLQAYAKGGIVDGPTLFPMKGSKTGLMGEDGTEAIMPLMRGPNGKLGVQAVGGDNTTIHINLSPDLEARILQQAAGQSIQVAQVSAAQQRAGFGGALGGFGQRGTSR